MTDDFGHSTIEIPIEAYSGDTRRAREFPHIGPNGRPAGIPGLKPLRPPQWADKPVPQQQWIVDGLIPVDTVTMLSGDGGLGKSLLALQLMAAANINGKWCGRSVTQCKSLGIFCEDSADILHGRWAAIADYWDVDFSAFDKVELVSRVDQDCLMVQWADVFKAGETTQFFVQVMNRAIDTGARLVVLDTLHDLFGGNENIRSHARQFIKELRTIAREIKGAVLLTAHPSLSGRNTGTGEAGSTAWNNAVRSRLYLRAADQDEGEDTRDQRVLETKKSNYGRLEDAINLKWTNGVFVAEKEETGIFASIEKRTAEDAFLTCLDALMEQGRTATDSANSTRYAPKIFARMKERGRFSKKQLEAAMYRLFDDGAIKVASVKDNSRKLQTAIVRIKNA